MNKQIERVSRQLLLPTWTLAKQLSLESLTASTDTRFGLAALYLAAAGIRTHVLTGPQGGEWERRIVQLLPEASVRRAPQADSALLLATPDNQQLIALTIAPNPRDSRYSVSAGVHGEWLLECPKSVGGNESDDLFLGAALATLALRCFSREG